MRKILLFIMAMVAYISVSAEPVKPVPAYSELVADGETELYLYNVETGSFAIAGNDWQTRGSWSTEQGAKFKIVAEGETYRLNNYVAKFSEFRSMFADGVNGIWMDNNNGANCTTWTLTSNGDGTYAIGNTAYPDTKLEASADTRLNLVAEGNTTWAFVTPADYDQYWEDAAEYLNWKKIEAGKANVQAMAAELAATNVYTAEAMAAFQEKVPVNAWMAAIEDGTFSVENADAAIKAYNANFAVTGWRAATDIDDLLTSSWEGADGNFGGKYYINTWSTEGNNDGSNFKVPFFEYWTGDGDALGANTMTAIVPGFTPGMAYEASVWARVRIKNGAAAPAYGITFQVGNGESVNVCAGEQVGNSQFYLAKLTATGKADAEGNLTISFNVAADNNVSWLSWKNVYAEKPLYAVKAATVAAIQYDEEFPSIAPVGSQVAIEVFPTIEDEVMGVEVNPIVIRNAFGVEGFDLKGNAWLDEDYDDGTCMIYGFKQFGVEANGESGDDDDFGFFGTPVIPNEEIGELMIQMGQGVFSEEEGHIMLISQKAATPEITYADRIEWPALKVETAYSEDYSSCVVTASSLLQGTSFLISIDGGEEYTELPEEGYQVAWLKALADQSKICVYNVVVKEVLFDEEYNMTEVNSWEDQISLAKPYVFPEEEVAYEIRNVDAKMNLTIEEGSITVNHGSWVYFTNVEGGYALSNAEGLYLKKGGNNWTLTTTTELSEAYTVTLEEVEGGYKINEAVASFGLDDVVAGSKVYGDKKTADKHLVWTITEAVEDSYIVASNVAEGGVVYAGEEFTNGTPFSAKDLTADALTAIPVKGYNDVQVIVNGSAVIVNYDRVVKLADNTIITIGEKANGIVGVTNPDDNSHWYIVSQARNGETPMYDSETTPLKRAAAEVAPVSLTGQTVADAKQYLVRFLATETEGVYNVQFATGKYVGADLGSATVPANYVVYQINNDGNDGTHYAWNLNNKAGKKVDNNGAGNYLAFWGEGEVTSIGGNNDWSIYEVSLTTVIPGVVGNGIDSSSPFNNTAVSVEISEDTQTLIIRGWDGVEGSDLKVYYQGVETNEEVVTRIIGLEQIVDGEVVSEYVEDDEDPDMSYVSLLPQSEKYPAAGIYVASEMTGVILEAGQGQLALYGQWLDTTKATPSEDDVDPGFAGPQGENVELMYVVSWPGQPTEPKAQLLYTEAGVVGNGIDSNSPFDNAAVTVEAYDNNTLIIRGWDGVAGSDLKVYYQGVETNEEVVTRIIGLEQIVNGEVVSEYVEDDEDPDMSYVSLLPQSEKYPAAAILVASEMTGIVLEEGQGQIALYGQWLDTTKATASEDDVDPGFAGPQGETVELMYVVSWPGVPAYKPVYTVNGVVGNGIDTNAPFNNTAVTVDVYNDQILVIRGWDGVEGSDLKVYYQGVETNEEVVTRITGIEQIVNGEVVSEYVEDDEDPDMSYVALLPQDKRYPGAAILVAHEMTGIMLGEGEDASQGQISLFGKWMVAGSASDDDVDPGFSMSEPVEMAYVVSWPGEPMPLLPTLEVGTEYNEDMSACTLVVTPSKEGTMLYWTDEENGEPMGFFGEEGGNLVAYTPGRGEEAGTQVWQIYVYEVELDAEYNMYTVAMGYEQVNLVAPKTTDVDLLYTATGVVGSNIDGDNCPFANTKVEVEVYGDNTIIIRGWDGTKGSDLKIAYTGITLNEEETGLRITGIEQTVNGEVVSEFYENDDDPELSYMGLEPQSETYPLAAILVAHEMTGIMLGEGDEAGMGSIALYGKWYPAAGSNDDTDPGFGMGEAIEMTYVVTWSNEGDAITSVKVENTNNAIFNLNGVRLSKPVKGINIINGKKVIIK